MNRRDFLIGALATALYSRRAFSALTATAEHVIVVWLNGGPSHLDTFDPKPGTRNGGPFKAVKTRTEGLLLSEHLPLLAESSQLFSVVRSLTSKEGNHARARYYLHTGYIPSATVKHPSLGSWIAHERGGRGELPSFVSISGPSEGAGFFGPEHGPFIVREAGEKPANTGLRVKPERFDRRLALLDALDDRFANTTGDDSLLKRRAVRERALDLMRSTKLAAFSLDDESQALRARYGDHAFGRSCLLARRLCEAGVRFVEIELDGWDTHEDNFTRVQKLSQELDSGLATLFADLAARKLLDSTLVVCLGDFGRTPKINARDGRDHYPAASSVLLGGGGIRGGVVHGATDVDGAKVSEPVGIADVFATIVTRAGINSQKAINAPSGRPIAITDYGQEIAALRR